MPTGGSTTTTRGLPTHTVEENAAVLIHEVSHLVRQHDARKHAAAVTNITLWNTATDCEINDDLTAEGLPLPDDPPRPDTYGLKTGENAETYYRLLLKPAQSGSASRRRSRDLRIGSRLRVGRPRRATTVGAP